MMSAWIGGYRGMRNENPRSRFAPAAFATLAMVAVTSAAHAAPVTFLPGDLAITYSVYPGLTNPFTGSTWRLHSAEHPGGLDNGAADQPHRRGGRKRSLSWRVQQRRCRWQFRRCLVSLSWPDHSRHRWWRGAKQHRPDRVDRNCDQLQLEIRGRAQPVDESAGADGDGLRNDSVGTLDASKANTPGHIDPTNTDIQVPTSRSVVQINADGTTQVTNTGAYSGNNGRAAILANNVNGSGTSQYLIVGNAGNGSGIEPASIATDTGVRLVVPGVTTGTTTSVGLQQGTLGNKNGFQEGFAVQQTNPETGQPYGPADKSGKDNNYRGETIFGNTLYVTKGSGGNGVNTVYQVGATGTLPTAATAATTTIAPLPGFPTFLATPTSPLPPTFPDGYTPFGIWFANASTLYVADEGDGTMADAATDPQAGLGKWSLVNGSRTTCFRRASISEWITRSVTITRLPPMACAT